ncbi:MAG: hypothetical protein ACLGIK_09240 [Gemmatimonadota bacterium]
MTTAMAQQFVWASFGIAADTTLRESVQRTAAIVRDDLTGDARSCAQHSPQSRPPHLVASRQMR